MCENYNMIDYKKKCLSYKSHDYTDDKSQVVLKSKWTKIVTTERKHLWSLEKVSKSSYFVRSLHKKSLITTSGIVLCFIFIFIFLSVFFSFILVYMFVLSAYLRLGSYSLSSLLFSSTEVKKKKIVIEKKSLKNVKKEKENGDHVILKHSRSNVIEARVCIVMAILWALRAVSSNREEQDARRKYVRGFKSGCVRRKCWPW